MSFWMAWALFGGLVLLPLFVIWWKTFDQDSTSYPGEHLDHTLTGAQPQSWSGRRLLPRRRHSKGRSSHHG